MKKHFISAGLLIFATAFFFNTRCYPQVADLGNLLAGGAEDAELLIQPYITPAVNGFGAAMSGGWYNTAEPHKLGGFDLTFTTNAGIIPKKYETFIIDDSKLSSLKLHDAGLNITPTVAGENTEGPQLDYAFDEYSQPAFSMPPGMNSNYIPAPMVQVGIGLIKGTEVMIRYLPNIKMSDNEIGLWGLGGKHDIKQWIPGLKKFPVLQMSVMYGYTKLHTYVSLEVTPETIGAGSIPDNTGSTWDNQMMKLVTQSHTANLIVSANLPVVCFYGGMGFVSTKTNLKMEGDFPSVYIDGTTPSIQVLVDPIDMEIKNQDGSVTKPRFNAGVRFKLAVITIHFDYSWANYSVLTGGLGISIR